MREDGTVRKPRSPQRMFEDKYNLIDCRQRLREMVLLFDLQDYYLGSHVLSALQLAICLSGELKNYSMFNKYVSNKYVQESIKKVCLKNAPARFSFPVRLLKVHCQFLLFLMCWSVQKIGFKLPATL